MLTFWVPQLKLVLNIGLLRLFYLTFNNKYYMFSCNPKLQTNSMCKTNLVSKRKLIFPLIYGGLNVERINVSKCY